MAGNWSRWSGCGGVLVWSAQDSAAANTNYHTYAKGVGTGVSWFMAGPGVDPHYDGTSAEASAWGAAQAAKTLRAIGGRNVTCKVVWMDIELPGNAPKLHARARQPVEQRVHLDVQWPGQDPVCRGGPGPGGTERVRVSNGA